MPGPVTDARQHSRAALSALEFPDRTVAWTEDDCLRYALGVGAGGADPLSELNLTTENSEGVPFQVIPTFAVLVCAVGPETFEPLGVHGEQLLLLDESVSVPRAIPPRAEALVTSEVLDVSEHRRGFVVEVRSAARDTSTGEHLFGTRSRTLIRDERAGRPRGGPRRPNGVLARDREPAHTVRFAIAQNQCLLYRLSGGRNPLHSDPSVARRAGYSVPLLHGRCTFGFAARHLIAAVCDGDASRLTSLDGVFTAPVFPADELVTRVWGDSDSGEYDILRPADEAVVMKGDFECQR